MQKYLLIPLFILSSLCYNWTLIDDIITQAINTRVFPGAVVAVANTTHLLYQKPYGSLSYVPDIYNIPVQNDTKYDIASITKIMGTTWAIMNAVVTNRIKIDDLVSKYI
jgi:CubicO group peptidase (beta-lactamase class C family)